MTHDVGSIPINQYRAMFVLLMVWGTPSRHHALYAVATLPHRPHALPSAHALRHDLQRRGELRVGCDG